MDNKILAVTVAVVAIAVGISAIFLLNNGSGTADEGSQVDYVPTGSDEPDGITQVTVTDNLGVTKTVKYKPERVVCLSTYACEALMLLGQTDRVVAVTNSSKTNADQAEYFVNAKDIGNFNNPDMAAILKLDPDLIIHYGTQTAVAEKLDSLHLPYVSLQCSNVSTIKQEITALGKIFGQEELAEKYCGYYDDIVEQVSKAAGSSDSKKTVYMESFSSMYAMGLSSTYSVLALQAGADLIYKEQASATVSPAWVVGKNPDVIIKTQTLANMVDGGAENIYNEICSRTGFGTVSAVRDGDVHVLCSQLFAGPRCFAGLVACSNILNGDDGLSVTKVLTDYNSMFGLHISMDDLTYPNL
ncbi:MAG: ABC transporter substrate-binding protein [Candidatus Methanomethylophilaceae archaeon]|nr:ABC transporter substrate-binding protein [Candidatus Methanomethylophilaceae archaeon]